MGLTDAGAIHLAKIMYNSAGQVEYTNANAYLQVGTSTDAFDATETVLQGPLTPRRPMDGGFPKAGATTDIIQAQATFAVDEAEGVWAEWGMFNHLTTGIMFNRKVEALGTKPSGTEVWQLTIDVTIGNP